MGCHQSNHVAKPETQAKSCGRWKFLEENSLGGHHIGMKRPRATKGVPAQAIGRFFKVPCNTRGTEE